MKTGILGGTFDPPHKAHIEIAREAQRQLCLDQILFMVAGQPGFKHNGGVTPVEKRLEMVKLAIQGEAGFHISTIEAERPGPTYTLVTLVELRRLSPGEELYFILGWDNLVKLAQWHNPREIIQNCYLAGIPRAGYEKPDVLKLEKEIPGITKKLLLFDRPVIDISASLIREKIRKAEDINCLVAPPVAEYIRRHGLYTGEA